MNAATAEDRQVTRDDLESKMRELQGGVADGAQAASGVLMAAGAVAAVGVVAIAFWLGRRSGKKKTTVVEVRRV